MNAKRNLRKAGVSTIHSFCYGVAEEVLPFSYHEVSERVETRMEKMDMCSGPWKGRNYPITFEILLP